MELKMNRHNIYLCIEYVSKNYETNGNSVLNFLHAISNYSFKIFVKFMQINTSKADN